MNTSNFAQNVIARFDVSSQKPVLFFADDEPKDKVKAFASGVVVELPLEVYKSTLPLSENDTKIAVEEYKKVANLTNVNTRQRMPYKKMVNIVDRLSQDPNVPADQKQVLQQMVTSEEKLTKRHRAARQRYASDGVAAALTGIKGIPSDAAPDAKEAAVKELSEKLAKLLMTAL